MRAFGEGCAVVSVSQSGTQRGFAVARQDLPFELPPVVRGANSGGGNGVIRRIVLRRPEGTVTLNCIVPLSLPHQAFASSVEGTFGNDAWKTLLSSVETARELPAGFDAPSLDGDIATFEQELLKRQRTEVGASLQWEECYEWELNRAPASRASFDCSMACVGWDITITFNGDSWSFNLSLYGCVYQGGSGYGWLVGNGYVNWCGGSNPNDADVLREQYKNHQLNVIPACSYFLHQPESQYFGYDVIESHDLGRQYTHAIFRNSVKDAIDALYSQLSITITTSNRIYTSPNHQYYLNSGAMNSRHVYGDAADIHSTSTTWDDLKVDMLNVLDTDPCVEPKHIFGGNHLHIDYRSHSGALAQHSSCPTGW